MSTTYNVRDHIYVKLHGLKEFIGTNSCELHPRKYIVLFCWYRITEQQYFAIFYVALFLNCGAGINCIDRNLLAL